MGKYKICPSCGEKNDPSLMECSNCGEELFQVGITDEGTENNPISEPVRKLVKYCDCGATNPPNARKCEACGEDISDISPEPERITVSEEKSIRLFDTDGNELYMMNKGNFVIGRSNGLSEYLFEKTYVSNSHCRLFSEGEGYFIEDLNSTNSTFLNSKKIIGRTILSNGDEIALGGIIVNGEPQKKAAYFSVKIE